jgi:hypothetical protein
MGPKRPTPLDLSGVAPTPAGPAEPLIDAPEDLDFQPREFRLADGAGAMVAAGERLPDAGRPAPELPALSEEARAARVRAPRSWPFYVAAGVVSLLWALAPIMFAWGYRREIVPFANDPFALAVLGLLAVGPMALVWLAAYVAHQGARLASETRRAQILADTLLQPAALAARGAGTAVETVRREIEQATAAAAQARDELMSLRQVLAAESRTLVEAAQASVRTAAALTSGLGAEREKMGALAGALDAQAVSVTDAITRHATMVAEASDLAETQIREAEAALAARAADLAAAAGEASDAARIAGEDLARQVARLETAGLGVGDQVRTVEDSLTQQRAALVTVAHGLRAEHEAFAAEAESQRAQLAEIVAHARDGASEVDQSAVRGAQALRQLIAEAVERLHDIAETSAAERAELSEAAARERDRLGEAATRSLGAVSEAAASERNAIEHQTREAIDALAAAAEQARRAAETHVQTVRDKIDHLGEAAFAAGQRADTVFESRLTEARGLVEQSARMVEDAGARSAAQLAQGVATARETLAELERLLASVDARIGQLPADAEAGAEQVRASLERGMSELMASARKAAEETQRIDAVFQDRVRRNYDMLSEAVRLMGVVAGAASTAPPPANRPPPPRAQLAAAHSETAVPGAADGDGADEAGLRPRLKLTPTATDDEFKTVFETAGGREPAETGGAEGWTWKELLSSMDEAPPSDESLASALIGEIEAMGVDAAALLPRPRIDEIAAAIQAGDADGALEVARRLAPAAIRRLSRRMLSDRRMRTQSERYVRRYQGLVDEALGRGDARVMISALLGSDQGRAFLLLDAALGDVA